MRRRFKYAVSPLEALVLLWNVMECEDAENDMDRTVEQICAEIDGFDGYMSRSLLESALYCANMNQEDGEFWHPREWSFDKFVVELLPMDQQFDKYYNVIHEKGK